MPLASRITFLIGLNLVLLVGNTKLSFFFFGVEHVKKIMQHGLSVGIVDYALGRPEPVKLGGHGQGVLEVLHLVVDDVLLRDRLGGPEAAHILEVIGAHIVGQRQMGGLEDAGGARAAAPMHFLGRIAAVLAADQHKAALFDVQSDVGCFDAALREQGRSRCGMSGSLLTASVSSTGV